jgi:hypothetical protein
MTKSKRKPDGSTSWVLQRDSHKTHQVTDNPPPSPICDSIGDHILTLPDLHHSRVSQILLRLPQILMRKAEVQTQGELGDWTRIDQLKAGECCMYMVLLIQSCSYMLSVTSCERGSPQVVTIGSGKTKVRLGYL